MAAEQWDLARILSPVGAEAFLRDHWEKKTLILSRKDPNYYRGLPTLRDVDDLIAFSRPKFLEPGDFKPSGPAARPFVSGWLADDEPTPAALYPTVAEVQQAFLRGKTLILNATERRASGPAALCRALERSFGCPVHANLYLTPKGAQGFHAHFDGHEVFVLQLEGAKHWRFYGRPRELPLPDEDGPVPPETLGPVTQEATVEPGDLLYMPRGQVHEAFTSDRTSMHLTVGVKVYRMADLVRLALDAVSRRDARFREAVPLGVLPAGRVTEPLQARFGELLRALAEAGRAEEAIDRLASGLMRRLPPLPGDYFRAAEDAEAVGPETVLERAPGVVCRVAARAGWVALEFPGGRVEGPPKIATALQFVARTPRLAARDLPDDLAADGKLILVRRLVRARVLVPAGPRKTEPEGGARKED